MRSQLARVGTSILLCCLLLHCDNSNVIERPEEEEFDEIKVMSFNVLYTTSNETAFQTLLETDADIIGFQEISTSRLVELAQKLHYHSHSFSKNPGNLNDQDTGILSRFPFTKYSDNGVVVKVNPGLEVGILTVHLAPYPYQPYDFRDGIITTPDQAVEAATETRLPSIATVLEEIEDMRSDGIPVFLTGDFNEPSHLDWTTVTAGNNLHFGKVVEWPVSQKIAQSGLVDAYRTKFINPADFPGITWTTMESPDEVYDRIDIIYHSPDDAYEMSDVRLVGGPGDSASIKVKDYASDHYAVVATYELKK